MAAHKKHELPGWFPFALLASGLIAVAAGVRSNWGRPAKLVEGAAPSTGPKQAGTLQEWFGPSPERWFFWYVLPFRGTAYSARGPLLMTDQAAFQLEFDTKTASLGALLYRFAWVPAKGIWVYDKRNDPALLASNEIDEAA